VANVGTETFATFVYGCPQTENAQSALSAEKGINKSETSLDAALKLLPAPSRQTKLLGLVTIKIFLIVQLFEN